MMNNPSALMAGPRVVPSRPVSRASATSDDGEGSVPTVLSFDVEEHHRIEAAAGLEVATGLKGDYRQRMSQVTDWILEQLAARGIRATFFIVGQIAEDDPDWSARSTRPDTRWPATAGITAGSSS